MDVLEYHSVDVNVVFNHYMSCSIGFLTTTNGFLTSLAVLTAVVSFWKLRSSSIPPSTTTHNSLSEAQVPPPSGPSATETSRLSLNVDKQVQMTPTYSCSWSVDSSSFGTIIEEEEPEEEDADMSTTTSPRKFTVMYYGDVENGEDETTLFQYCRDVVDYDENNTTTFEASPLLRTRKVNNDMGWYRHQDLSVLNGNVVKLWGSEKQRKNSRRSLASSPISTGIRS